MPRNITQNLTSRVSKLNIKIITNIEFGKDITLEELKKNYSAIFLGIGADITSTYSLTDKPCKKIYKASYILREYNAKKIVEDLGNVIIIGRWKCCNRFSKGSNENGSKISYNSL